MYKLYNSKSVMAEGGVYEIPKELLKSLDCPICKDKFTDPKIIDCMHIFCLKCLQDYVEKDSRNFPPCPVCRRPMLIPEKGVRAYPNQTFYADIVQCLEAQVDGPVECSYCGVGNSANNLNEKCVICKQLVCSTCHQEEKHKCPDTVKSNLSRRSSKCHRHGNEIMEFYCIECQTAVCKRCKDSDHIDHKIQSLHIAAINCKKALLSVQEKLDGYKGEMKEAMDDLQKFMDDFNKEVAATKEQIETEFDNIVRVINEKKLALLEELHTMEIKRKKRVETELEEMETKEIRAETLDELSNNLMKYGSDSEAVQFEKYITNSWDKLSEEALWRYGKGFRLDIHFQLKERIPEMLEGDIGFLTVSQYLSPWPKGKHLDAVSPEAKTFSPKDLEIKLRDPSWQRFPIKRSKVFSKLVDPKYRLGASKICPVTGTIITAWIKSSSVEKSPTIAEKISQQFVSRPSYTEKASPTKACHSTLEVDIYKDTESEPRTLTMNNIPDITDVRLAMDENGDLQIAMYPGSVIANGTKKRESFKRLSTMDDCIYVVSVKSGMCDFDDCKLRKIDILELAPEYSYFLFEITKQGYLVVHHPSYQMVFVYSPSGEKKATKPTNAAAIKILGICEASEGGILVISTLKGAICCEEYTIECVSKGSFCIRSSLNTTTLVPQIELKNVCFDMRGNMLLHFRKDGDDQISVVCAGDSKEEILCKPEIFHKVDQMSILPQGRLCLFDKTECVLMTLQYLQ